MLRVDPALTTAVYRQIVDGMRLELVNGVIKPGDVLPSVRRLALDLGVHFNTVAQAYRALAREGWLKMSARGRAQVRTRAQPRSEVADTSYRRRLEEFIAQLRAHGVTTGRLARELRRIASALEASSW